MFDTYLIILTAFAIFGLYSLFVIIFEIIIGNHLAKSVTFIKYSNDDMTYQKYKSVMYNIYNNKIVFIGNGKENIYKDCQKITKSEILEIIENNLFTN